MTTLPNRPNTALLVIDVQNGVVARAHERDAVIANIFRLIEGAEAPAKRRLGAAQRRGGPRAGTWAWQYAPSWCEARTSPSCTRATRTLSRGPTSKVLAELGVGHLVVADAQSDECVRATLHGAITRGYDATLVERSRDRGPERVRLRAQRR